MPRTLSAVLADKPYGRDQAVTAGRALNSGALFNLCSAQRVPVDGGDGVSGGDELICLEGACTAVGACPGVFHGVVPSMSL